MPNPVEVAILRAARGSLDELRKEILRRHQAGEEVAAPHDKLFQAAHAIKLREGDIRGAMAEVVHAHRTNKALEPLLSS